MYFVKSAGFLLNSCVILCLTSAPVNLHNPSGTKEIWYPLRREQLLVIFSAVIPPEDTGEKKKTEKKQQNLLTNTLSPCQLRNTTLHRQLLSH